MVRFAPSVIALLSALHQASAIRHSPRNTKSSKTKNDKRISDPLEAEFDIKYNGCDYELKFSFKHNDTLPIGDMDTCVQDAIASDGLPYLASREFIYPFSDETYEETGFASHSLDFQACGHPDGICTTAHYDMHFYTDPADVREGRLCDLATFAPICNFTAVQSTDSGRAFFNVATIWDSPPPNQGLVPANYPSSPVPAIANMPADFTCDAAAAVPGSGIHCWDFNSNPSAQCWCYPVLVMGSYDAKIAFFEPTVALDFVTGVNDASYHSDVAYEGKTIKTLPYHYSVSYVVSTGRTTIILKGKRNSCAESMLA